MNTRDIATIRLANQQIADPASTSPAEVVTRLLAVQAQDYRGALWSIGLRQAGSKIAQVEQAIAERSIVRTWPMRGTLHFVAATDVRWMLKLLTPRVMKGSAGRMRQLEIDDTVLSRSRKAFVNALRDGSPLTRDEMYDVLGRAKIEPANQRGIHILSRLSQEGLLCVGPHRGKQPTFALLDEWIPGSRTLDRDESLAELTSRYFRGHGPATVRDFAWWCGLTLGDARAGVAMIAAELTVDSVGDISYLASRNAPDVSTAVRRSARALYLLPGFDEYMLGYADRGIALDLSHAPRIVPGNNGMFMPTIVARGRVIGTWRSAVARRALAVTPLPFVPLSSSDTRAFAAAAGRYAEFLGHEKTLAT
jgi:hypothetical protein